MRSTNRISGIDIIGGIPWGTHFCQFYQTREDLMDILIPYFKAGLENNEFCLWVISDQLYEEEAKQALKVAIPEIDAYIKNGQIEIVPYTYWHVEEGALGPQMVLNQLIEKTSRALDSGYDGLRYSGNGFFDHEKLLEFIIGEYPMIALCTYSIDKYSSIDIIEIAVSHHFILENKDGKWGKIENFERKAHDKCRQTEEALRKSEEHYRMLFTNMTDGFGLVEVLYDKNDNPYDYRYLEVNPAFERILGVKREQMLGKTMLEVFPNVNSIATEKYSEVSRSGEPTHFEIYSKMANKYLDIYAFSPEKGKVAIILRDFTKHKQLEEQTSLRAQELETIMEVVPAPILISHDLQGYNITGNRMANEFYGAEVGENISASATKGGRFFYKGRELRPDELPVQQAAKKNINIRDVELEALLPSGKRRIITVSASPLHNSKGHVRGSVGAFIDITKRKEAEAKLNDTLENLDLLIKERTTELQTAYNSLKKSEKSLAEAQEIAHIGSWERDFASNEYSWSDELYRIFGLKPQESKVNYHTVLNYAHPDDRDYIENAVKEALKGKTLDINFRIIRSNGEGRIVHAKAEVIFDKKNNPVRFIGTTQDVTENRKAEEEIQSLANIVESSNDAIGTISLDNIITRWNKASEEVYGYSAEEIIGKHTSILAPPHLDKEISELSELIKHGKKIHHHETSRLRKDGKIIDVSITLSPVFDSQGKLIAISVIARDITERKRVEEKLRESEEKYRNIVETANEGIGIIDSRGIVTFANKKLWDMLGYSVEEGYNKSAYDLLEDATELISKQEERLKGVSDNYELKAIRKDGSKLWVLANVKPLFSENGEYTGSLGMFTDITKLKEAEKKLIVSEEKYRTIVETANEGIGIIDNELKLTYVNKKIEEMLGYSSEEIIGKKIWDFLGEESKPIVKSILERGLQDFENPELKYIRKDGSPLRAQVNAKPIFDDKGKYKGIMTMITDITKRKEAEEALENIEIVRKKEIHHRIKNNLQVISSLLDLQAAKFKNREYIKDLEVLEAFRESQDRVISMALIHEELYKGGRFETLNFSPYIEELASTLFQTYRLGDTDISLNTDMEENLFFEMDTAVPLGIIVNELISNSLKHAFPDIKKGEIRIKLRRDDEHKKEGCKSTSFTLTISDNGVGIPENLNIEDLDSLGMQLVTSLVDQLDGELELKRDNGTEFTIRFTVTGKNE